MTTKNPRINITFTEETVGILSYLAKKKHKSVAGFTKELVEYALEFQEDIALSKIANELDTEDAGVITHENIWK